MSMALGTFTLFLLMVGISCKDGDWMNWGGDLTNRRYSPSHLITPQNIKSLRLGWELKVSDHLRATPAVSDGIVYFPADGNLTTIYAVNGSTGDIIWSRDGEVTRTTPVIYQDILLMGSLNGYFFALNRTTGKTLWKSDTIDANLTACVTQSGTVTSDGLYLVGLSSDEEMQTPCCFFRGRLYAINATTGEFVWITYFVPDLGVTPGYAGAAVWGSAPSVDESLGLVFVTTGNNYQVPVDVQTCLDNLLPGQTPFLCQHPDNHDDSILALNLTNGQIVWSYSAFGVDWWSVGCDLGVEGYCSNNSQIEGHDFDFGQSPLLFISSSGQLLLGAGNKGGVFFTLDRKTGKQVWTTRVGPASSYGGIMWGSSADEKFVYVGAVNYFLQNYTLQNGTVICTGAWVALDIDTGKIVWQTPDPNQLTFEQCQSPLQLFVPPVAMGPLSTGAGIVYGASYRGTFLAMNRDTGEILWSYKVDNIVVSGPALVDNWIYWGTGMPIIHVTPVEGPGSLFAFTV